jgi:AcrR family transcriptional regulator
LRGRRTTARSARAGRAAAGVDPSGSGRPSGRDRPRGRGLDPRRRRAGRGRPPSIYLHFADKDALLDAVCIEAFTDLHEAMNAAGTASADPLEALRAQGRAYVDFALSRPEHYRLMFMRRPDRDLDMPTEAEVTAVAGLSVVIDSVRSAQNAALIDPTDDPVRIALSLWAGVHGIAALLIAKPHFPWGDTDELIDRVLAMTLHGAVTPAKLV